MGGVRGATGPCIMASTSGGSSACKKMGSIICVYACWSKEGVGLRDDRRVYIVDAAREWEQTASPHF